MYPNWYSIIYFDIFPNLGYYTNNKINNKINIPIIKSQDFIIGIIRGSDKSIT